MTPTAGTTPRPWEVRGGFSTRQIIGPGNPDGITCGATNEYGCLDNGADAALIVYAVNHIEAAEAALTDCQRATVEALRHDFLFVRTRLGTPPEKLRMTEILAVLDAFLAAHAAPEEDYESRDVLGDGGQP